MTYLIVDIHSTGYQNLGVPDPEGISGNHVYVKSDAEALARLATTIEQVDKHEIYVEGGSQRDWLARLTPKAGVSLEELRYFVHVRLQQELNSRAQQ